MVMLTISPEKVCFVITKAREFDVKDTVTESDPGSNPSDDKMIAVLEDHSDDPVVQELTSFVSSLNQDDICSARRCSVTSWRKAYRSSGSPARISRISKSTGSE